MNEPLKAGNIGWSPDYKGSVEEKLESLRVYPIRRAPDPLLGLVREARDRVLSTANADAIEAEMRRLEDDPSVSKHALRLFMQAPMPCGHAAGNLLTCDSPPNGCVICGESQAGEQGRGGEVKNWDAPHFKKGKLKSWKWRDKRRNARTEKLAKVETPTLAEVQESTEGRRTARDRPFDGQSKTGQRPDSWPQKESPTSNTVEPQEGKEESHG